MYVHLQRVIVDSLCECPSAKMVVYSWLVLLPEMGKMAVKTHFDVDLSNYMTHRAENSSPGPPYSIG